jgi:tRNA threonylcarbamoyladenosine biosynthesis protein TsaB
LSATGRLLAIETATDAGGAALLAGERLVGERRLGPAERHAGALLPAIDALLGEHGWSLGWLDAIALSVGPGSFTGLRVGLATALGLCFDSALPIVPVPTLAALSLAAAPAARIAPWLDARRGQVYAGWYGPAGAPLGEDRVGDPGECLALLPGDATIAFLGSGALRYAGEIRSALGPRALLLPAEAGEPSPGHVGRLGLRLLEAGRACDPRQVRLRYLRPAEAEAKRLESGLLDTGS